MKIVAVLNQKGGVGKTTTAVNLGAALALRGKRVLLVDSDPQANLSDHLGIDPGSREVTLYDVLTEGAPVSTATVETETEGLHVLPADPDLAAAEQELATELGREMRLRRALAGIPEDRYDWVLIDCPPSLGLLSLNALAAAEGVLITVQTEYFAMRGLAQLDDVMQMVREHVNPKLELLGILPTLVSPVTRLAREVIQEIRAHYKQRMLRSRIRQNVRLAEAPGHRTHIFAYEPGCSGADDYLSLADEILGVRDIKVGPTRKKLAEEPIELVGPKNAPRLKRADVPDPEPKQAQGAASKASGPKAPAPKAAAPKAPAHKAPAPKARTSRAARSSADLSRVPQASGADISRKPQASGGDNPGGPLRIRAAMTHVPKGEPSTPTAKRLNEGDAPVERSSSMAVEPERIPSARQAAVEEAGVEQASEGQASEGQAPRGQATSKAEPRAGDRPQPTKAEGRQAATDTKPASAQESRAIVPRAIVPRAMSPLEVFRAPKRAAETDAERGTDGGRAPSA